MSTALSLIAAVARNRVIGRGNALPWHLPEDLKRFRQLTLGHPVVMGRRTYESIGRPLPGRDNIVVTRNAGLAIAGVRTAASLPAALDIAGERTAFVIGGAEIYQLAFPLADRLYLTEVDADVEGDAFFPEFDRDRWRETAREPAPAASPMRYAFVTYSKIGANP